MIRSLKNFHTTTKSNAQQKLLILQKGFTFHIHIFHMEDERNHGRAEHFLDYFLIPFPNAVRPYFFLSILERDDIFSLAINLHKIQKKKSSLSSLTDYLFLPFSTNSPDCHSIKMCYQNLCMKIYKN